MDSHELENTRIAFSKFATGVCIVTAAVDGKPVGMTVSSFNSVSLDPPLVLWSVGKHAPEYAAFCGVKNYVVHILSSDQIALSNRFATPGIDKFDSLDYELSGQNVPLIAGAITRFHCSTVHNYPAGDHNILVGSVDEIEQGRGESPLIYYCSDYRSVGEAIAG